ncbi:MAG: hypothetical protein H7X86_07155 [Gorillibacterium sp.]|nr:hypothetical protein [Gorillibacterium sp.]
MFNDQILGMKARPEDIPQMTEEKCRYLFSESLMIKSQIHEMLVKSRLLS